MNASETSRDPLELLDAYDFELPERSIAQAPAAKREESRLMVLDRASGALVEPESDHRVRDLPRWLRAGDLLVVNTTRVLAARLRGRKATGGSAEVLLLGPAPQHEAPPPTPSASAGVAYRALLRCTGRVREGLVLELGRGVGRGHEAAKAGVEARVAALHDRGEVTLVFPAQIDPYAHGEAPLPPYIRRQAEADAATASCDLDRYQTVYAREPGAIAAPTAGLHLTHELLESLQAQGVEVAEVVLHVGAGTFRPLDATALESGRLHREVFELPASTAEAIRRAHARGGRVVAVGTTTARVLETRAEGDGGVRAGRGETDLFIRPGGPPFRVVDALLTNFHLPRSSLLLLVAEFAGRAPLLAAYQRAIEDGFRFYSYGDAMLIGPVADQARHG
jgi:S-adenosylmethionine:tRNA ribosyltransferase-isomerase